MDWDKLVKSTIGFVKNGADKLTPPFLVGGIHVTDTVITYLKLEGEDWTKATVRLAPGVVSGGVVVDKEKFEASLHELKEKISPNFKEKVFVVLSLSTKVVYIQPVTLPEVGDKDVMEATVLNMQMVSPIDADMAYMGWQAMDSRGNNMMEKTVLGAFVPRDVVDNMTNLLHRAGFRVAVVEFETLSLARAVRYKKIIEVGKPYIIVEMGVAGVQLAVVRKGVPLFHVFHPWKYIQGDNKVVVVGEFMEILRGDVRRIMNFYSSRWGNDPIEDLVIISSSLVEDISKVAREDFPKLNVHTREPAEISAVEGAAIRGKNLKDVDFEIDLSNFSDRGSLLNEYSISFVHIWRNTYTTALGFLMVLFLGLDIFMAVVDGGVLGGDVLIDSHPQIAELNELQNTANEFNSLVMKVGGLKGDGGDLNSLLQKVSLVAGPDVTITRLQYSMTDKSLFLVGSVVNQEKAIEFKNRLQEVPEFLDVDLPLTNITVGAEQTDFRLGFEVSSLEFSE